MTIDDGSVRQCLARSHRAPRRVGRGLEWPEAAPDVDRVGTTGRDDRGVITWEYVIVALPEFQPPTQAPGASAAVVALNREGELGWEAVGMTALKDGAIAVLLKRQREA